jgi:hypothetical protein
MRGFLIAVSVRPLDMGKAAPHVKQGRLFN